MRDSLLSIFRREKKLALPTHQRSAPEWRPAVAQSLDRIVESVERYTNGGRDFAVFRRGTVVILPQGLSDENARAHAAKALRSVVAAHPVLKPTRMSDGNILVRYKYDVINLVLAEVADKHWRDIDRHHARALTGFEVIYTSLGRNQFDDVDKKALFGRCYLYMDARDPHVDRLVRFRGGGRDGRTNQDPSGFLRRRIRSSAD
jgi:hypothetical protein